MPSQHASVDIAIIKHPPSCEKYFFPILFKYFVFKNPYARVLAASFALLPRVLNEQHPRIPVIILWFML